MSVYLDVGYSSQLNYGPGGSMSDPTGCWYSSAIMVGGFFEQGPRFGVPELHTSNLPKEIRDKLGFSGHFATGSGDAAVMMKEYGGGRSEHDLLAQREHLIPVKKCATNHAYTLAELERTLRKYGPIFFYWVKTSGGNSYGHASVLIGTDDTKRQVLYHDPENLPNSRMSIKDFNAKRQKWKYALMRRKCPAYGAKLRTQIIDEAIKKTP